MYKIVHGKKEYVSVARKTLALFGGSFDPVHSTHLAIAKYVHAHCHVDYVVLVPTKQNPLKDNCVVADNERRLAMIHALVNNCKHILVDDFELVSDAPISYTYNTLEYIKNTYSPAMPLQLIVGSDTFSSLDKWKHIQKISELSTLLVIPRKNYNKTAPKSVRQKFADIKILENFPTSDISSTVIRSALYKKKKEDISNVKKLLPSTVYRYIQQNNLY